MMRLIAIRSTLKRYKTHTAANSRKGRLKLANLGHFYCHYTFHNIPSFISHTKFILIAPPLPVGPPCHSPMIAAAPANCCISCCGYSQCHSAKMLARPHPFKKYDLAYQAPQITVGPKSVLTLYCVPNVLFLTSVVTLVSRGNGWS